LVLPISAAELLIAAIMLVVVCYVLKYLLNIMRKNPAAEKSIRVIAGKTAVIISVVYFAFLLMWGFNYYRLPFADIAGLDTGRVTGEELEELCKNLINQANELRGMVIEDSNGVMIISDKHEVLSCAGKGYEKAAVFYPELAGSYSKPKEMILSGAMSTVGISGLFLPFTGEANVNMQIPDPLLPAAVCHEMAHQRGFAREDEANYLAYFSCNLHPDTDFKYSGTFLALIYSMKAMKDYDYHKYLELCEEYSAGVASDLSAVKQFWQQHRGTISRASSWVNNIYLKANQQEDGIQSYGGMVDLLIAEKRAVVQSDV